MKPSVRIVHLSILSATCALLAGCIPKPNTVATRSFVLRPVPPVATGVVATGHLAVGIGLVKMPQYLLRSSMAVRRGAGEIDYLDDALWAERLDQSFQRTLAADLSAQLPTDQIRLSAWEQAQVALAVYVSVEQFDVDAQGRGVLVAWWRITTADGEKVLKSGQSRLSHQGPPPYGSPQTMVTTLSDLTAEFGTILATAIRESVPVGSR